MVKFLIGVVTGIILVGLVLVILLFAAVRLSERPPAIADGSVVVLRLEGEVPERAPLTIPLPFFEARTPLTVSDVWDLVRKAEVDSRIQALVLMPNHLGAGWGKLAEIRGLLARFRKTGKPLVAFLRSPSTGDYYVATAADHIYMPPEDILNLKGLRAELMFFRKTLDKIGVQVEIEHAGIYKDYGDMFTRTSMRPETRRVVNSILDELYGRLIEAVADGRQKTVETVRATIDDGPFLSKQALSKGLVDALLYEDQVFNEVKKRLGLKQVKKVSGRDYLRVPASSLNLGGRQRIALVVAEGAITSGGGEGFDEESSIRASEFTRLLRRVGNDSGIRAVVVRIDSPGGSSSASDEIWREMNVLSKKKPLVISMSDAAASGGYYIAMTGDPIVAYPGTFTGSIGVLFGKVNLRGLYDKLGIQKEFVTRGRFADIDSDYTPLSEAARKKLRAGVEDNYRTFVQRVAEARKREYKEVEPLAQGRVWLGSQANERGLVDELGGLDRAIELAREKAQIPEAEKTALVVYPSKRTIFDRLFRRSQQTLVDSRLRKLLRNLRATAWLEGGMLRLMPYTITVQ
jgi:protease-4